MLSLVAFCCLFTLTSCSEQDSLLSDNASLDSTPTFIVDENENGHTHLPTMPPMSEDATTDRFVGYSHHYENAERIVMDRPDGTSETMFLVDDDVAVTKEQLVELQQLDAALEKQYHTNNLVSITTINVVGYTGSGYNLTSKMRTALSWAVNNYNALNTNIQFNLRFAASTNGDIIVYRNISNNNAGGVAGFPSGGRPYKWVQLYNGMNNYDTNTNEHVITHEIGHCMGLRHTDWFSRASCGEDGESAGSTGANYIPGTPSGSDPNSVMLACFGSGEDGEFGFYDRVALEYLY